MDSVMTFTAGTGAAWLDLSLMGVAITLLPAMAGVYVLSHPGASFGPAASLDFWFALIGISLVAAGVALRSRTHWALLDPKVNRTK